MANVSAPFGFRHIGSSTGASPTFANSRRLIASGYGTAIFFGDPVMPVTSSANGYIILLAAGSTRLDGIFVGCTYFSTAQKRPVYSNYWPGSDATGDVTAYVIDDPGALFVVQGNSTTFNISGTLAAWTSSPVGQYAQVTVGTGSTATGISAAVISSLATTVTFPFIVKDLVTAPPGANGADPLSASNHVIVGFNNEIFRSNGAGPTGIS